MPSPDQIAEAQLVSRGFVPGTQVSMNQETLKAWIAWGIAEGQRLALTNEQDRLLELQKAWSTGDPPIFCSSVCLQKIRKLNPHSMDRSKVAVLSAIARVQVGNGWVRIRSHHLDGILEVDGQQVLDTKIPEASAHAARLRWFGLFEYRGHRTGEYRITQGGLNFLKGRASVPKTVWCRSGVVVSESSERVVVSQVAGVTYDKDYWDRYSEVQTYVGEE